MIPRAVRLRAALLCALLAPPVASQQVAAVYGRVTDRVTGFPLTHAQLTLVGDGRVTFTDSVGRYELTRLPMGVSHVLVKAIGFPSQTFIIELGEGQRAERPVLMDSSAAGRAAQKMATVDVRASAPIANYRLVDFERRRQHGRGQYLTEDDIVSGGAFTVADAVKKMRGVTYECGGGTGCYIRMVRAPMRCLPEFVVDDHVMNDFGPLTPIRDIVALELYTGPSEVPGEYAGRNSGCGVVVIWTRSGPARFPKEKSQSRRP